MKKIFNLLVIISFTTLAAFASMPSGEFKQLLKTGTAEQVRGALTSGVDMKIKDSFCYALRYSTQPGIIKVLADNGADIYETKCFSPVQGVSMNPLMFSTFYKNLITTEDLLKLGVPSNNFSQLVPYNLQLTKVIVKYADTSTIKQIFGQARAGMNDSSVPYLQPSYGEVVSFIQKSDFDVPGFKGKSKADIVMQLGAPQEKTEIDKTMDVWTYYNHIGDTRYNGTMKGSSYNWGYGLSTVNGSVLGGYTETTSEKYTIVFKDGVVIKAKINYDCQTH